MPDTNQAGTLTTEPVTAATANKSKAGKKKAVKKTAVKPAGAPAKKEFKDGDAVVFHVKHLHGLHGTIVMAAGANQYVVRGGEENIEGQLFQFSADQLESATEYDLSVHHSHRGLDWDYKD